MKRSLCQHFPCLCSTDRSVVLSLSDFYQQVRQRGGSMGRARVKLTFSGTAVAAAALPPLPVGPPPSSTSAAAEWHESLGAADKVCRDVYISGGRF